MTRSILGIALVTALSSAAQADCRSATAVCICQIGVTGVARATVISIDGPRTTLRLDTLAGAITRVAVGDTVVLPREPGETVGATALIPFASSVPARHLVIDAASAITCTEADPPFTTTAAAATTMMLSPACFTLAASAGFSEPQCHDCGCAPGSVPGPGMLIVVASGLRLRRRRGT